MPQDPLLAPLFATRSADHPKRVAKWLGEVFCGPPCYSQQYGGYPRMLSQHLGKFLTEEQRVRWVALLLHSAREAGLPNDPEFRSAFQSYIEWGSRLAVENAQAQARPPERMPMPRWDWNTAAGRQFAFDLWSYDDVGQHAAAILERLRNGTMPCDGAWPKERIDAFTRWIDTGAPK